MSNDDKDDDEVLERNVSQLLAQAHQPPQLEAQARGRVLTALKQRVRASIRDRAKTPAPAPVVRPRPRRWGLIGAGAGLGALAAAAAALLLLRNSPTSQAQHLDNPGPGPRRIELADGSELVLAAGAEVVVDVAARRAQLDRGEAMFDIAPAAGRAFVVDAPHGRATVLGTRFVVSDEGDATSAAVVRGVVRLENSVGSETLHAGEQGVARAGAAPERRRAARLSHLVGWAQAARREAPVEAAAARNGVLLARRPDSSESESPLPIRDLTVDIRVENQVARVAIDQTFFNPQAATLEGVYRFPLPADASIARLAMYVDGKRMDAAVVERTRGREIYESIVYQRRDPALLEWMNGNLFQLRIFPLPGRTEKRLALQYTQSLRKLYGDYQIAVPIPELDEPVGVVRYRARLVGCTACEVTSTSHAIESRRDGDDLLVDFERRAYRIGDDLLLDVHEPAAGARVARFHGPKHDYLGWRVQPVISDGGDDTSRGADAAPGPRRWVILHDTSASRGRADRKAQAFVIDRLLRELDEDDEVQVVAFDVSVRAADAGFQRVADVDRDAVARFLAAESVDGIGFTDLGAALAEAVRRLDGAAPGMAPHILYLGDGLVTGGERAASALAKTLAGHATFVGVAVGDRQDAGLLRGLAAATGGLATTMNPGDDLGWRAFDLIATLNTPRIVDLTAELETAEGARLPIAVYADAAQLADGEDLAIVAQADGAAVARLTLRGRRAGAPWQQRFELSAATALPGQAAYLPRLWAQRRIDALRAEDDAARATSTDADDTSADDATATSDAAARRSEMTQLGTNHFLLTPYTSLLVLENEEMYRKFAVKRDWRQDFAEYSLPDTIPVVVEPLAGTSLASAPTDALVVRTPIAIFASYRDQRAFRWSAGWDEYKERETAHVLTLQLEQLEPLGSVSGKIQSKVELAQDMTAALTDSSNPMPVTIFTGIPSAEESAEFAVTGKGADHAKKSSGRWAGSPFGARRASKTAYDDGLMIGGASTRRGYRSGVATRPQPIALQSSHDPRLDDLTELVPGMFADALDEEVAALRRRGGRAAGTISDDARDLLERARAAAPAARFRWTDGQTLDVATGADSLAIERTLTTGLVERLRWDGATLVHDYPELDLVIRRDLADGAAAVIDALAPMRLPAPAALARWYQVTASGHVLTLRVAGPTAPAGATSAAANPAPTLELELDAALRLIEVRRVEGGERTVLRHLDWSADHVTIVGGDARTEIAIEPPAPAAAARQPSVFIELPLRTPAYRRDQLAHADPGGYRPAAWFYAAHQLLASLLAVGDIGGLRELVAQMIKPPSADTPPHALSTGELLLAARGVLAQPAKTRTAILAAAGDSALVAYLRAAAEPNARGTLDALDAAAARAGHGLLGSLASYRALLASLERASAQLNARSSRDLTSALATRLTAFASRCTDPTLRYLAASEVDRTLAWSNTAAATDTIVTAWDTLTADGPFAIYGGPEAVRALYRQGRYDEAASRLERVLGDTWLAEPTPIDYLAMQVFQYSRRGPSGWNLVWGQLRQRVLASRDPRAALAFLDAAQQTYQTADIERASAHLAEVDLGGADEPTAIAVADALLAAGRAVQASAAITPRLAAARAPTPALLAIAAAIAERQEHFADAAALLERALAARDDGLALGDVRADYRRVLALRGRAAQIAVGAARDTALAAAAAAAAAWRELDPANPAIDQTMSEILYVVDRPAEAWRYLSTAIELAPADGDSYRAVAETLERQGELDRATALWQHAAEVDPTNPTWRLRHAQALFALGRDANATAILDALIARRWHERWLGVVEQARHLRPRAPTR